MATFEAQVEGLTGLTIDSGSSPTQDQLSQYLKDGVIEVTNRIIAISPEDAQNFQRTTTSDSQGVSVGGAQLLGVMREANADGSSDGSTSWEPCRLIPPTLQSRVVDVDSLEYASIYNPVYTIENDHTINVYPVPSSSNGMKVYYVNEEPRDITNNAALVFSHENIKYFPNDKVYLVVLYASCKALQNAMASKSSDLPSDITVPSLDVRTISLPIFVSPNDFILPQVPDDVYIVFTNTLQNAITAPDTYSAPVFNAPSLAILESIPEVFLESPPDISGQSIVETEIDNAVPTYTKTDSILDFADANNWLNTEEDSEMVASRVQVIQSQLEDHGVKMQDELNEFNKEMAKYQVELQIAMDNARLADNHQQRSLEEWNSKIQEYQIKVNEEIQKWTAEEFTPKFQEWTQEWQGRLQEYSTNIQNESTKVQSSLTEYQAEVNKRIQTYQAETGYDLSKYQAEVQSEVQRYTQNLTQATSEFKNDMDKYTLEIQGVGQDNQLKISLFSAEVQDYANKIAKVSKDYEWMQARHEMIMRDYNQGFGSMAPQQAEPERRERRR